MVMKDAFFRFSRGPTRCPTSPRIQPSTPASIASEPDDKPVGGDLLDRLRALKLAQATGMVLTTREARWILGRKPVANERLERLGVNAWRSLTN
jgi:hypothetical protein